MWWFFQIPDFLFSPWIPGEDEPIFDDHIFQMGWFNHQPAASHGWQEPVNELRVSALGSALDVAASVASRMERDQIGVLEKAPGLGIGI